MTSSEQMIKEALARAREKEGVAIRVRMSDALFALVQRCARAVHDTVLDWTAKACGQHRSGKYNGVAYDAKLTDATRVGSVVVWVRAPKEMTPDEIRVALANAVTVIAPTLPADFSTPLVEGRDYFVERNAE
jgi:hypothetical protein